jgi:hypothetical protein
MPKRKVTSPKRANAYYIGWMGDSISYEDAYNVRPTELPPAACQKLLNAAGSYVLVGNFGIAGQTTLQMAVRINELWGTPYGVPSAAVIMGGVNDPGNGIPAQTPGRPPTGPTLTATGSGNVDAGLHDYVVTYYNIASPNQETQPGPKATLMTASAQSVTVTIPTTGCPSGWGRKVYRTKMTPHSSASPCALPYPQYQVYLVATQADNTTTSITDNTADTGIGAGMQTTVATAAAGNITFINVTNGTTQSNLEYMIDQLMQAGVTRIMLTSTHWKNYAGSDGDQLGTPNSVNVPVRVAQWGAYATFGSGVANTANPFGSGSGQVLMCDLYNQMGAVLNANQSGNQSATYLQTGETVGSAIASPLAPSGLLAYGGTNYKFMPLDGLWHVNTTNQHPNAPGCALIGQITEKTLSTWSSSWAQ